MKVESRGKFPGVKLHLEAEEVTTLLEYHDIEAVGVYHGSDHPGNKLGALLHKIDKKVRALLQENPNLLTERTKEEIAAILIKEAEKSQAQLAHLQATGGLENLDKNALKSKLLHYVKE